MRVEPIPYEPKPAEAYARELDVEAYRAAQTVRDRVRVINDISYLRIGEAAILYNLYAECAELGTAQAFPAMEIGARFGCSTLTLALASREHNGAGIVSVDPHGWVPTSGYHEGSLETLRSNLQAADLANEVLPILGRTEDVVGLPWNAMLCLAFIDGDHSAEGVTADIEWLAPLMASRGILCGHDYFEGKTVAAAVDAYAASGGCEVEVQQSVWILRPSASQVI